MSGALIPAAHQCAGGQLVQQRFPQVGLGAVHQRDVGSIAETEPAAQARGQSDAAGAAADDDDSLHNDFGSDRSDGLLPRSVYALYGPKRQFGRFRRANGACMLHCFTLLRFD